MADGLRLRKIHHVELWVGNAKQAAYYYRRAFGFSQVAYRGPETGCRDRCSYALEQGTARLVLTTPLHPDSQEAEHVRKHGDSVRDIAFEVDDAAQAFEITLARGAEAAWPPAESRDEHGVVRRAAIRAYGDTIHSLIGVRDYRGPFLPGFVAAPAPAGEDAGLLRIDHMVGNVELGKMNEWAGWYSRVLGFERYMSFDDKDISTEYSALMSIVMSDDSHSVKFPINEPAPGPRKSQIQEYLEFHHGPGVQHIALQSRDILHTVRTMRRNGVEFLYVPASYYDALEARVGGIEEPVEAVRELGILVDRDHEGYLLQLFTKPVEDRPTLFFEIIQRHGSRGFGKGNFKALFEAIEAEQARRGNL
ncbi:MAG: 4-hydroxyphenylpyruvate dioxygenase [Candidatus Solibacter usitatus]|nr:4-hydroxyphenylpyruvate dioxygenase [Candidatus Solibacter usitatus]